MLQTRGRRVLAGTVLLAALGTGWFVLTDRALDGVTVSAGDWQCTGTTLVRVEGTRTPVPLMTPGMRCRRTLAVRNDAVTGVRLGAVTVPELGSEGAPGVRLASVDGRPPRPGGDARVDIGQHLAAGTSAEVDLVVEFRPDGCSPLGRYRIEPTVTFRAWGRSRAVPSRPPLALAGSPESDCLGRLPGRG